MFFETNYVLSITVPQLLVIESPRSRKQVDSQSVGGSADTEPLQHAVRSFFLAWNSTKILLNEANIFCTGCTLLLSCISRCSHSSLPGPIPQWYIDQSLELLTFNDSGRLDGTHLIFHRNGFLHIRRIHTLNLLFSKSTVIYVSTTELLQRLNWGFRSLLKPNTQRFLKAGCVTFPDI